MTDSPTSHAPEDVVAAPSPAPRHPTTHPTPRGIFRWTSIAAAAALLALVPVSMWAPPASAALGDDRDGDLVADIADLDDDDDGMSDERECDGATAGARFVDDAVNGRLGLQLRPSDLGMALSDADVTASLDISQRFGYPAGTGAVVVTAEHANRHPGADVFIGGVNPVADGTPTRFSFSGTLGVYLDIRHDLQWFDADVKTLETHDGTVLTDWFQLADPAYAAPGFSKSESAGAGGRVYTITGPPTVNPYPTIYYNGYSSELAGSIPNLRFVRPTTEFSFDAALVHAGLYPVINIFMYAECDTDLDGIGDRLDTDSDNDSCPDSVEGTPVATPADPFRTAGVVSVTTSPQSVDTVVGSAAHFSVGATASSTDAYVAGVPDLSAGVPEAPTYQWFVSTDDGGTFSPVAGATASTLVIDPVTSVMAGDRYRVRVASPSNPCGVDSAVAALTVFHPPVAVDDADPAPMPPGGAGEISIFANDDDPDGSPIPVGDHTVDLDPSTPAIDTEFVTPAGRWTYDPGTGIVRFESAPGAPAGVAAIDYRLCDPTDLCSVATVSFVVGREVTTTTAPSTTVPPATAPPTPARPVGPIRPGRPSVPAGSDSRVAGRSGNASNGLAFTGGDPGAPVAIAGMMVLLGVASLRGRSRNLRRRT